MSLVLALLGAARAALRTHADLALENLALRQQLALLRRRSKRPRFSPLARVFWVWLSQRWVRWREALHVVRPETVIRWHRLGCRAFWTWKSRRGRTGRPPVGSELADLVRTMALANPLWGCRLPTSFSKTGRWASGVRAMDRNVPRTRSLGRPARGAQNPHRPRAREPSAPTAARPAQPPIEATPIRAPRSRLLVVALQPVVWMAPGALPRTPRDRNSLAPAGLPRLLDLEVPPRATRSTAGWLGDCGSRARHGARESPLGRATHPRRIAQARTRRLAAKRRPAHAASPETAIADVAHVPPKPPRRPRLHRLLRRADRYLSRALRVRGPAASSPPGRALQRDRFPHRRLDRAASRRGVPR